MSTLSMSRSPQGEEGQAFSRKHMGLRIVVLVGLGAMFLTVFSLLPGCGSDSNTLGTAAGKKAKDAKSSAAMKPQVVVPLLTEKGTKIVPNHAKYDPRSMEVFPGTGITQAELEAKMAASRKKFNPNKEVFPGAGITQAQLEAKLAAERKNFNPKSLEVFPGTGITQAELEAKLAAARKSFDPKSQEVFPGTGITQGQLEAKLAAERKNFDAKSMEVMPEVKQKQ